METLMDQFPLDPKSAAARSARRPVWLISIEGKDVTREISPMVLSVTYADHVHGKTDSIDLQIEDSSGKWRGGWYPQEGDRIELSIGFAGDPLLKCGSFQIDECEESGPPDVMTVRAIAAGPKPNIRTRRSTAYEGQTLRQIADQVAARHSMTVVGTTGSERIQRITQHREDDMTFLMRVSESFGYAFNVRGDQLIFYSIAELEDQAAVVTIGRGDALEYTMKRKTHKIYRACELSYHHPGRGGVIRKTVTAPGVVTGDTLKLHARVENEGQAEQKALAALRRLNSLGANGVIRISGNPRVVAGVKAELVGYGIFDGQYQAMTSEHRITRAGGYDTTLTVKRVGG